MKRIILIAGMMMVLLAMAFAAVSSASAAPHSKEGKRGGPPAKITWSQKAINTTLSAGQSATVTVTFTSTADIASPNLVTAPGKAGFVQVSGFPTSVTANTPYSIDVQINVPANTTRGSLEAVLFVKDQRALAKPLPVHVKVPKPKPARIDWSQRAISETVALGQSVTASVTFTSTKDIVTPTVVIKPESASLVQVSGFPSTITANTPYSIDVQISVPADAAADELEAMLYVKDQRLLERPLKIRVAIPGQVDN